MAPGKRHSCDRQAGCTSAHLQLPTCPLPLPSCCPGARETIYYDPKSVTAAIVTCGGLCPGLNDVVQGLVNKLNDYGVPQHNILGIK
jgi:6-phosphofructokinase 1